MNWNRVRPDSELYHTVKEIEQIDKHMLTLPDADVNRNSSGTLKAAATASNPHHNDKLRNMAQNIYFDSSSYMNAAASNTTSTKQPSFLQQKKLGRPAVRQQAIIKDRPRSVLTGGPSNKNFTSSLGSTI